MRLWRHVSEKLFCSHCPNLLSINMCFSIQALSTRRGMFALATFFSRYQRIESSVCSLSRDETMRSFDLRTGKSRSRNTVSQFAIWPIRTVCNRFVAVARLMMGCLCRRVSRRLRWQHAISACCKCCSRFCRLCWQGRNSKFQRSSDAEHASPSECPRGRVSWYLPYRFAATMRLRAISSGPLTAYVMKLGRSLTRVQSLSSFVTQYALHCSTKTT